MLTTTHMTTSTPPLDALLPPEIAGNAALRARLEEELGTTREGRGFFPTLRIREVCLRARTRSEIPDAERAALYEGAALIMVELLLARPDLRLAWRPLDLMRILADVVRELPLLQRRLLLLHLGVGLSASEIADVTSVDRVQDPLDRALFLLTDRLRAGGFALDQLHAGGIGPVGEVTRVLERVRDGEVKLMEALAADYQEILRIAERKLGLRRTPGFDAPSDIVAQTVLRLPADPETAPRNRKELRSLVSCIIYNVVVDHNLRVPVRDGGRAIHEEADEQVPAVAGGDEEDRLIHAQMLDAVSGALERIRSRTRVAIVPATQSLQDVLLAALLELRVENERQFRVLLAKIEGGRTNDEIASEIGISVAAVKRDYRAAIESLREKLAV
jgi:DNA-directed RNA polymerase specialized sigma24 family protein